MAVSGFCVADREEDLNSFGKGRATEVKRLQVIYNQQDTRNRRSIAAQGLSTLTGVTPGLAPVKSRYYPVGRLVIAHS
jgi:hypothetical protein